jgi:hypothetical protein
MQCARLAMVSRTMLIAACLCLVGLAPDCFAAAVFVPRPKPMPPRGSFKPLPSVPSKSEGNVGVERPPKWQPNTPKKKKQDSSSAAKKGLEELKALRADGPQANAVGATPVPSAPKVVPFSSLKCTDKNGMTKPCE